jgi:Protein of unknown function (DUF559)
VTYTSTKRSAHGNCGANRLQPRDYFAALTRTQIEQLQICSAGASWPLFRDFVCREQKLVIELDGATHGTGVEIERDERRSAYLADQGYRVIRFNNAEVFDPIASSKPSSLRSSGRTTV